MCLVHKQPVNAQLLKSYHIIFAALGLELFQPCLQRFAGFLQLLDRETLATAGLYLRDSIGSPLTDPGREQADGREYGIRMEMVNMLLEIWKIKKPGVLFVTHEIDEALTVATRIAVLTPSPTTIQTWITLPGREGRDASAPELTEIRREIIGRITA